MDKETKFNPNKDWRDHLVSFFDNELIPMIGPRLGLNLGFV